jgi:hypothetical protein
MYRRCLEFMPLLEDGQLDPAEPGRVGLRPVAKGNVCLQREPGTHIVPNYGHGGSGFASPRAAHTKSQPPSCTIFHHSTY